MERRAKWLRGQRGIERDGEEEEERKAKTDVKVSFETSSALRLPIPSLSSRLLLVSVAVVPGRSVLGPGSHADPAELV